MKAQDIGVIPVALVWIVGGLVGCGSEVRGGGADADPGPEVEAGPTPDEGAPDPGQPETSADVSEGETWVPPDVAEPGGMPGTWRVRIGEQPPPAITALADEVAGYLESMGLTATVETAQGAQGCEPGAGILVLTGEGLGLPKFDASPVPPDTWRFAETWCEGGALAETMGASLIARQHAVYQWLHRLGARFFHPEDEYVPAAPEWGEDPRTVERTPSLRWRSVGRALEGTALAAHLPAAADASPEAQRYLAWQVKNLANLADAALGPSLVDAARARGMAIHGEIDAAGLDQAALQSEIDALVQGHGGLDRLTFSNLASELDLEALGAWMLASYPGVRAILAVEADDPAALAFVDDSPTNLTVSVGLPGFWDLQRDEALAGALPYLEQAFAWRGLELRARAPAAETTGLPLYLPSAIESQGINLQALAPLLADKGLGVASYRIVGSGHEWGAWQVEYCALRMAADLAYRWSDCALDLAHPAGQAAGQVAAALAEVAALQEADLLYGKLWGWLQPTAPGPFDVLGYEVEALETFSLVTLPALELAAQAYEDVLADLRATPDPPEAGQPWVGEIYDGIEITGLRAAQRAADYGVAAALLEYRLLFAPQYLEPTGALHAAAQDATRAAQAAVTRREAGYRHPVSASPYLAQAHTVAGWRWLDEEVGRALLAHDALSAPDVVLSEGESLELSVGDVLTSVSVDFGDGQSGSGNSLSHVYEAPGLYTLVVEGEVEGEPVVLRAQVARVTDERHTGLTGKVLEPPGVDLIEVAFPGVVTGIVDADTLVAGFSADEAPLVPMGKLTTATCTLATPTAFDCSTPRAIIAVRRPFGEIGYVASASVLGATFVRAEGSDLIEFGGSIVIQTIIDAVGLVLGFDQQQAADTIASLLGYTPDTMPPQLTFAASYTLQPAD